MMETFDVYLFGYVAGYLTTVLGESGKQPPESPYWGKYPFSYQAFIVQEVKSAGLLDVSLANVISFILSGTTAVEPELLEDGTEKPLSMPLQGHWVKGYFQGVQKIPMYPLEDYILRRRKQSGMSQDALSKKIGVPQSQVGRWEKGKEKVPPKHYWKIIGILEGYSGEQI